MITDPALSRRFLRRSGALLFLLIPALFAGCRSQGGGDVLAKVNGKEISRTEVDKYYQRQIATPQAAQGGEQQQPPVDQAQAASLRLSILSNLIDNEVMMQRAEKLGLLATDEEVESKLAELKAPYTQEEFERSLKEQNMAVDDFKRDLRRTLTVEKVINKEITSKISISDGDISTYYNEHKAEFNFIEPQYHLSQILVTPYPVQQVGNRKNDKATNEAEARKKIQMLLNRLESGEDFATVAMNYSEHGGTAGNGGDMGFIPESALRNDPTAYGVISKMKPGQTSSVIPIFDPPNSRNLAGYRIVRLNAREPAGQRELNDPRVQQAIRQQLRARREQLLKAAYYETVRNEADVENFFAREILKNAGAVSK